MGFQQAAAPSNYNDNHNDALENSTVSVCGISIESISMCDAQPE